MHEQVFNDNKRILSKLGVDTDKYFAEETVSTLSEYLDFSGNFLLKLLAPAAVLLGLFGALSAGLGSIYDSRAFGVWFFVLSLIVSLLGGGVWGVKNAMSGMLGNLHDIVKFALRIVREIYISADKNGTLGTLSVSDVLKLVMFNIVLPMIRVIVGGKFLVIGDLVYWVLEIVIVRLTKITCGILDKLVKSEGKEEKEDAASVKKEDGELSEKAKKTVAALNRAEKQMGVLVGFTDKVLLVFNVVSVGIGVLGSVPLVGMVVFRKMF